MPFQPKRDGSLNHREELSFAAIDREFDNLSRTILSASGSQKEMRKIIEAMEIVINEAKALIYKTG